MSDQSSNRPLAGKAVTYKALGGPEVIEIVERTVRAPAAGEVRIEVKAAAVNPTDILFRDPGFGDQFGGDTFPIVPGMDAAGIIESVGPGAESQPLCRAAPRSDPVLGESSTRCSSKRSPTREAKWLTLSRKATRSYSSIASVVRIAGSSSAVPARAITSSGRPSISTPFVTAKSSKTPS